MRPTAILLSAAAALSPSTLWAHAAEARTVPYVDAHSHLLDVITADEEIALFRKAGLDGVVIMDPKSAIAARP